MLRNLLQASVGPQLKGGGCRGGDVGVRGSASKPARKRTKCCQLFLGMQFIFIFYTSGTIVYILPGSSNVNTLEVLP